MVPAEGLQVAGFIIGYSGLPAFPENADPNERQGAHDGPMRFDSFCGPVPCASTSRPASRPPAGCRRLKYGARRQVNERQSPAPLQEVSIESVFDQAQSVLSKRLPGATGP